MKKKILIIGSLYGSAIPQPGDVYKWQRLAEYFIISIVSDCPKSFEKMFPFLKLYVYKKKIVPC